MAIQLLKPIKRQTLKVTDRRSRIISVTLIPGDMIRFQAYKSPRYVEVSIAHCYNLAILMNSQKIYDEQMAEYNRKKKLGHKRLKKPKMSTYPFSKIYFQAAKK